VSWAQVQLIRRCSGSSNWFYQGFLTVPAVGYDEAFGLGLSNTELSFSALDASQKQVYADGDEFIIFLLCHLEQ
jgi:hypothetical protein